jgi:hypothetical protein
MAGNDSVKIKLPGPFKEPGKFDKPVTIYTGIRGIPPLIAFHKTGYHPVPEIFGKV